EVGFVRGTDLLVSRAHDGSTRFWDPVRGQQLLRTPSDYERLTEDGKLASWWGGQAIIREVVVGREFRTFHHELVGNAGPRKVVAGTWNTSFSPDGRLLASASNGVRIWEIASGRVVGDLDTGQALAVRFDADGSHLLTYGAAGLVRWSLQADPAAPSGFQVAAPEKLGSPAAPNWGRAWSWGAGGELLAAEDLSANRDFLVHVRRP